jgi:TonB family protein
MVPQAKTGIDEMPLSAGRHKRSCGNCTRCVLLLLHRRISMFINLRRAILSIGLLTIGIGTIVLVARMGAQEKTGRKIIKRVEPVYPALAGQLHLSGTVKMVLQITPEGKVTSVHTVGGNAILVAAAEDAAKQWKYEPSPKESSDMVTFVFEGPK